MVLRGAVSSLSAGAHVMQLSLSNNSRGVQERRLSVIEAPPAALGSKLWQPTMCVCGSGTANVGVALGTSRRMALGTQWHSAHDTRCGLSHMINRGLDRGRGSWHETMSERLASCALLSLGAALMASW